MLVFENKLYLDKWSNHSSTAYGFLREKQRGSVIQSFCAASVVANKDILLI